MLEERGGRALGLRDLSERAEGADTDRAAFEGQLPVREPALVFGERGDGDRGTPGLQCLLRALEEPHLFRERWRISIRGRRRSDLRPGSNDALVRRRDGRFFRR